MKTTEKAPEEMCGAVGVLNVGHTEVTMRCTMIAQHEHRISRHRCEIDGSIVYFNEREPSKEKS